jgi:hypothetical protein
MSFLLKCEHEYENKESIPFVHFIVNNVIASQQLNVIIYAFLEYIFILQESYICVDNFLEFQIDPKTYTCYIKSASSSEHIKHMNLYEKWNKYVVINKKHFFQNKKSYIKDFFQKLDFPSWCFRNNSDIRNVKEHILNYCKYYFTDDSYSSTLKFPTNKESNILTNYIVLFELFYRLCKTINITKDNLLWVRKFSSTMQESCRELYVSSDFKQYVYNKKLQTYYVELWSSIE